MIIIIVPAEKYDIDFYFYIMYFMRFYYDSIFEIIME